MMLSRDARRGLFYATIWSRVFAGAATWLLSWKLAPSIAVAAAVFFALVVLKPMEARDDR